MTATAKAQHTAGPWAEHDGFLGVIVPANHVHRLRGVAVDPRQDSVYANVIALVTEESSFGDRYPHRIHAAEGRANARLIAAAPEMLEALRELADASEAYASSDPDMLGHADDETAFEAAMLQARAAIAKAEGRDA